MKRNEWRFESINVQRCAQALVKKSLLGEEIPLAVFQKMAEVFTPREIKAVETYHALHILKGEQGIPGCDYMTLEEMEAAMEN